ncbi:hypothetical protein ACWY2R_03555 [Enterococcus avium]
MINQKMSNYQSPFEIELLFDNKKLEVFQYLIILYACLKDNRKRKLSIEQLLYFYTIIFSETDETKPPLIFKYNKDKSRINEVLIALSSLQYIEVDGKVISPIKTLKFSITKHGIDFLEGIQSPVLEEYIDVIRSIIHRRPYEKNSVYFKNLLYEGNYTNENQ